MTAYLILLLLTATVLLGPWMGRDSRGLSPDHVERTHPLHPDAGANCS